MELVTFSGTLDAVHVLKSRRIFGVSLTAVCISSAADKQLCVRITRWSVGKPNYSYTVVYIVISTGCFVCANRTALHRINKSRCSVL